MWLVALLVIALITTGCFSFLRGDSEVVDSEVIDFEDPDIAKAYKPIGMHNPILPHKFGADPYAIAYEDRVYVYSTNDSQALIIDSDGKVANMDYGRIRSINVTSSADLVNWTDHGWIDIGGSGGLADGWAHNSWAPAATYKNIGGRDQFFLYFANNGSGIGVLTSDHPAGPFEAPLDKLLVSRSTPNANVWWLFDPAVVIDNDGTGYLYFGGGVPEIEGKFTGEYPGTARVVELGDDMVSLAGTPQLVDAPWFFEAAFVHKIGETFFYSYCTNWSDRSQGTGDIISGAAEIAYMTSKYPMGPWDYQGTVLENPGIYFGSGGNNHHSMVEFNGQWYIFYHTRVLQDNMGISGDYRSTHVDEINIFGDYIEPALPTRAGVEQLKNLDPYQNNEAETMAWAGNIDVKPVKERSANFGGVNTVVTDMESGSFIGLSDVDFGNGSKQFTAKVASIRSGNAIKITTGSPENDALGYLEVPNTGRLNNFVEVTVDLDDEVSGVHDLFFVFMGGSFDFDAWHFHKK